MAGVSAEEIARAKQWDLLSYLQTYEPDELKRSGPNEYRTVSHDSLVISNGLWDWKSQGIGGQTALDYLIKVQGQGFVDAVRTLCGNAVPIPFQPVKKRTEPKKPIPFVLPEAAPCATAAISYLQRRGIDGEILSRCMQTGIFYESRNYHNCVFVGKDRDGFARFACLRGTLGSFKADAPGSDKRYGFCLSPRSSSSRYACVFESPTDALSLATLRKMKNTDWEDCYYLSLGGTSPLALLQFLHDRPEIDRVYLCLDNDRAGMDGMARLEAAIHGRPLTVERKPPPMEHGKDYNALLNKSLFETRRFQSEARKGANELQH